MTRLGVLLASWLVVVGWAGSGSGQVINDYLRLWPEDMYYPWTFADALDFEGNIAVVGCPIVSSSDTEAGRAYVFDMTTGQQLYRIEPENGHTDDRFGYSVAMQDGLLVFGAIGDDDVDFNAGAAYVYDTKTGQQLHKLYGSDIERLDLFGISAAIGEGVIAVGCARDDSSGISSGAVYLFDADTGAQIRKLIPDPDSPQEDFGFSLAIHDGLLVVGAPEVPAGGGGYLGPGNAYIFDLHTGEKLARLFADDGEIDDQFGYSVAIDSEYLVIGARWKSRLPDFDEEGAVYVYERDTWNYLGRCTPRDSLNELDERMGYTVAVVDGIISTGALGLSNMAPNSGGVILFDASTLQEVARLLPSDAALQSAQTGRSLAVKGNTYLVGSKKTLSGAGNRGGAFLFEMPCRADTNLDGTIDHTDFTAWINAFNNSLPECDQNGDGSCTATDFTAWIANFNAGCS